MSTYRSILPLLFIIVWMWAAINPLDRETWILENLLVFIFIPLIIFAGTYFRFSTWSYTLVTIFLTLHVIGSHYTYAETPFGEMLGRWLGMDRNIYDRLVHFAFGLFLAYPIREVIFRLVRVRGVWSYVVPFDMTVALSALYEIVEWGTAVIVDPHAGIAFLGSQGDQWDAQKDMALAALGAFLTLFTIAIVNWRYSAPFRSEVKESLHIGEAQRPEGEVHLREVIAQERLRRKERRERKKDA